MPKWDPEFYIWTSKANNITSLVGKNQVQGGDDFDSDFGSELKFLRQRVERTMLLPVEEMTMKKRAMILQVR